jgi:hypothetical protein
LGGARYLVTNPNRIPEKLIQEAVNRLRLDAHYLSCGAGEPGRDGHAAPPTIE